MNGILMTPDNHLAIREGRKTVTRRVIKPQFRDWQGHNWYGKANSYHLQFNDSTLEEITKHSHYQVGEVVYIKEAWRYLNIIGDKNPNDFGIEYFTPTHQVVYWRDNGNEYNYPLDERMRSPLFMPAKFARDFIQIIDVSPCRTRDITFEDCLAEGIVVTREWQELAKGDNYKPPEPLHPDDLSNEEADKEIERGWIEYTRQSYFRLYDSINGKGAHEKNWDWRYEFKKVAQPCANREM